MGRRWERFGHQVSETRPGTFEIRNPAGERIGWVTMIGERFEAHGFAQSLSASSRLEGGPYYSGRAALLRVVAAHEISVRARELREQIHALEDAERRRLKMPAVYGQGIKRPGRYS
ncbi:MAG: hypothetical protein QM598_05670 [Protaetiibacter sp.]